MKDSSRLIGSRTSRRVEGSRCRGRKSENNENKTRSVKGVEWMQGWREDKSGVRM